MSIMEGLDANRWALTPIRKRLVYATSAFAIYLVLGFFIIPGLVKWQLLKRIPLATHRRMTLRQVRFNPFALSITIRGLALTETNGRPFASFDEFYANFQLSSLFRRAWTFDEISLKAFRGEIVLNKDGQFNFANLFKPSDNSAVRKASPGGGLPRVIVFHLNVTNGFIGFSDLSRKTPFRTAFQPINLSLNAFTTQTNANSTYQFEASSDSGRRIAWDGTFSVQPLESHGNLQFAGIALPKHAPYIEDLTRALLTDGTLDLAGRYSVNFAANGLNLAASNLDLTLNNLELKDPARGETVASVPSMELRNGTFVLQKRQLRAASLVVKEPKFLVRRNADNSINIPSLVLRQTVASASQSLTAHQPSKAADLAPWLVALDDYQLKNGSVQFEDATLPVPFRSLLKPVNVRVQHFSTATNATSTVQAELTTEANEAATLSATYSVSPPRSRAAVKLSAFDLNKYQPYLAPIFRGTFTSGKANLALESFHEFRGDLVQVALTNASLQIADLQIRSPDDAETWVTVPQLTLDEASGNLLERTIRVGRWSTSGAILQIRREEDGSFNLLRLIHSQADAPSAAKIASTDAPAPTAGRWTASLNELALREWTLHLTDRATPKEGKLDLDQLSLTLRDLQLSGDAPVATEFSSRVNGSGSFSVRGMIHPNAQAAEAELEVVGLELRGFQTWLEQSLKIGIESGALSSSGHVEVALPSPARPQFHFTGSLNVTNFATLDQVLFRELMRWDDLSVKGIDFQLRPNQAKVEQVALTGLRAGLVLDPARKLNFLSVLPSPKTNISAALPVPMPSPAVDASFPLQLNELKLEKASFTFQDQSVEPPCAVGVQELNGLIKGLCSQVDSNAEVEVTGSVDESSPFALRGRFNPLARDLALDLVFTNHNLQLEPFSPYLEKYGGHPLNKGRLSLNLKYSVEGKQLKAENKLHIDQMRLGPRNQSPDATKLPVKLAVALLKDNSGRIDLDLPLDGRLDDPQFSIGPVILKVVANLIVKAAASPFKLLGALVGGGEELSFVDFDSGTAQLRPGETNKLNKLIQALEKRPGLNLEIEGSVDPADDRAALARRLIKEKVRTQRLQELSSIGQAPPSLETFQIAPADYLRLLRELLVQTCGTNLSAAARAVAERSAATTKNAVAAQPGSAGPSLAARIGSVLKPKKERAAITQAHLAAKSEARLLERNPELAQLTTEEMETLLTEQTDVPADQLRQLIQDRAKAVEIYLISSGKVLPERLLLVAPKMPAAATKGSARVNLALG